MNTSTFCPNSILVIDADYLPYAYGNCNESDAEGLIHNWFEHIFRVCNSRIAIVYLKKIPQDNFRYYVSVSRPYKGHRERELPYCYDYIIRLLITKYRGITVKYAETDDAIAQTAHILRNEGEAFIIVSDDKDLNQIHGWHYKHSKNLFINVSDEVVVETTFKMVEDMPVYTSNIDGHGEFKLWLQMIIGDSSDNILGVPNMGLTKARKLGFDVGLTISQAKLLVWNLYKQAYPIDYKFKFIENYRLLKLIDNSEKTNITIKCPIPTTY